MVFGVASHTHLIVREGELPHDSPQPGAAVRAFSLVAVFWGLRSAVKPVGAFYGGVGRLYMVSGSRCVYVAQNAF